jgi:hypothetical protein
MSHGTGALHDARAGLAARWAARLIAMTSDDQRAAERARAYFRRIGEYKAASHRQALEEHLALSLEQRLQRSWEFYERSDPSFEIVCEDGALQLYALARRLGHCLDGS